MSPHPPIHPGWLLVMPGGHLHSWLAHTSNHPDPQPAMGWFEPDSARRAVLIRQGWTARARGWHRTHPRGGAPGSC
jgi:hypothetical protein